MLLEPYLYGRRFTLVTDHRPLVWLHSTKDPTSKLMRWKIRLNEFDYDIQYKPGKINANADALSRNPVDKLHTSPASPEEVFFCARTPSLDSGCIEEQENEDSNFWQVESHVATVFLASGNAVAEEAIAGKHITEIIDVDNDDDDLIDEKAPSTHSDACFRGLNGSVYPHTRSGAEGSDGFLGSSNQQLEPCKFIRRTGKGDLIVPLGSIGTGNLVDREPSLHKEGCTTIISGHSNNLVDAKESFHLKEKNTLRTPLQVSVTNADADTNDNSTDTDDNEDFTNTSNDEDDDIQTNNEEPVVEEPAEVEIPLVPLDPSAEVEVPPVPLVPSLTFTRDPLFCQRDTLVHFLPLDFNFITESTQKLIEQNLFTLEFLQRYQVGIGDALAFKINNKPLVLLFFKHNVTDCLDLRHIETCIKSLKVFLDSQNLNKFSISKDLDSFSNTEWNFVENSIRINFNDPKYKVTVCSGERLVPPESERLQILKENHDSVIGGHRGKFKMLDIIKERFTWPGLRKDISQYIKSCPSCQRNKSYSMKIKQPMCITDTPTRAFEKIQMDIVGPLPVILIV